MSVIGIPEISKIEKNLFDKFKFDQVGQADQLKEVLTNNGAVIAGSAIMQSVIDAEWNDSDIDIWLPTNSQDSPVDNFCKATEILKCMPDLYNIPKIIKMCPRNRNLGFMQIEQYQRLSKYVTYIMTMHHKTIYKKAIQIIFVKTTIPEVIASFDIIASQIWYNGKEFMQILPEQFDNNNLPMSENIINQRDMNQGKRPIIQLLQNKIEMSKIAIELQSPYEWIRTIIRIEKYKTRFNATIDFEQKQSIVASIIKKIDIQHETQPVTEYSLRDMKYYIQNFKTAWNINDSCIKQNIKVRWNADKLEFIITDDNNNITSMMTNNPPDLTPVAEVVEDVNTNRNKWDGDSYIINNGDESPNKPNKVDLVNDTCFDFTAYDDENIINYLKDDDEDNIVIFDDSGEQPICYTRQRLIDLMNTASAVFYPCESYTAIKKKTMVRIQLIYNVVVPISDVAEAIKNKIKIFRIYKTATKFNTTKSANVEYNVHEAAMVSGDHCQDGTDKDLYRLLDADNFKSSTGGGKKLYTYNGLKYKLLNGKRGGKYIFVGEKKIYISEKDDLMNQIQNVRSRKANSIQAKKKSKKINK